MKKTMIKAIVLLSILSSMSMAESMYFGGGISNEDLDVDDNGIGLEVMVGKVFNNNFGIEGRVSKTITEAEEKAGNLTAKGDATVLSIFATYSHKLSPEFTIMPKIGFSNFSLDVTVSNGINSTSNDDSSSDIAFGIDLKYQLNFNSNLYASFTKYQPKLFGENDKFTYLSAGYQQNF